MRTSNKRQPGADGRKIKKIEIGRKSLKDLVAKDSGGVKGGEHINTQTIHKFVCA
jgi:hypothetical protein